jgi:transcriptional regulator with XRE-family HTH domain
MTLNTKEIEMTGDELKAWRKEMRLSQHDVAGLVGKSVPQVSRYESGHTPIGDDVADRIAEIRKGLQDHTIPFASLAAGAADVAA